MSRARFTVGTLAATVVLSLAGPAPGLDLVNCDATAPSPQTFTHEWQRRDGENQWCAGQRNQDQMQNPLMLQKHFIESPNSTLQSAYHQATEPTRPRVTGAQVLPGSQNPDPYRSPAAWAQAVRGRVFPLSFISSFTGAKLEGEIWLPPASMPGPYPAVIISTGARQQWRQLYLWAAQGLAESGYMVMTYDTQGQGSSESFNHTDDGGSFCTARGCPGSFPPPDTFYELSLRDAIKFFFSTPSVPYTVASGNSMGTNLFNPQHAALDRRLLDGTGRMAVGLAGHSVGGAWSMIVGQADPRISAIVSWDAVVWLPSGGSNDVLGKAHAPTLIMTGDYDNTPVYTSAPPDPLQRQTSYRQLRQLCIEGKQCIDTMHVALRAGTHYEWAYVPYGLPASRYGERVSFYYSRAWFDAYLKGAFEPAVKTAAISRLRAATFDGSADASSIGLGTLKVDTSSVTNEPYVIQGKPVRNRLSFYYWSSYRLSQGSSVYTCESIYSGC